MIEMVSTNSLSNCLLFVFIIYESKGLVKKNFVQKRENPLSVAPKGFSN